MKKLALAICALFGISLAQDRYLVQIPTDPTFRSEIIISNTSYQALGVRLEGHDSSGTLLTTIDHLVVPGLQTLIFNSLDLLGNDVTSVFIPSAFNDPRLKFVVAYSHETFNGRSHIAAKSDSQTSWRFYYDEQVDYYDAGVLLNTGNEAMDMTISQIGSNGNMLGEQSFSQIPSKGKFNFLVDNFFTHTPGAHYEVSTTQPSIFLGIRGLLAGSIFYENRGLTNIPSDGLGYISNVFHGSVTSEQLIVCNVDDVTRAYNITGYQNDGSANLPLIGQIGPGQTLYLDPFVVLGGEIDYLKVDSDPGVKVTIVNGYEHPSPLVHESMSQDEPWHVWRVIAGAEDQVDFVTLVNTSDAPINLKISFYNQEGHLLEEDEWLQDLAPGARFAWVNSFDDPSGVWIRVLGTGPFMLSDGRLDPSTGRLSHGIAFKDRSFCDLPGAIPFWNQSLMIDDLVMISSFCPK